MDLSPKERLIEIPNLRRRLRQLRWYVRAFRSNADLIAAHLGIAFRIDERLLNQTFFDWVAAIAPVEHDASADRADRILFMGGLALRELLRTRPARVADDGRPHSGGDEASGEIARFWPEGFLYTNFCVCSVAAVHEQEFGEPRPLEETASDLRTWWSFRENAAEDPAVAVAFLDRFFGLEPNWLFPADANSRLAARQAFGGRGAARSVAGPPGEAHG